MNFAPFSVATTNIFPCANSTAGAQLLSEFNLRSRESVATHQDVKYMIGPSYVHSPEDFSVSVLRDDLGNAIGNNTVFVINEGRGVINGHFIQSLTPIQIDLAVANQYLAEHNREQLKGKLKVGLRVMYSTTDTMAGAMLKENKEYYEGVHVVVLPEGKFKVPLDVPTIGQQDQVTAHLWLADITFVNGRISEIITQNPHKCEMLPASRISDIGDVLSGQFLHRPNVDAGMLYVYSGKLKDNTKSPPEYKHGWCQAQDTLMVWDADAAPNISKTDYNESLDAYYGDDPVEAKFKALSDGKVALIVPHKQVDDGITDTLDTTLVYPLKQLDLPVADYAMGTAGTVDRKYTDHIKELSKRINNVLRFTSGTQRGYIEVLNDVSELPQLNPSWNVGDYILVGQDNTVLSEGSSVRAPATMYFVLPGYVQSYTSVDTGRPSGVLLDHIVLDGSDDRALRTTTQSTYETFFDLGSAETGWNYRGISGEDYFQAEVGTIIPSLSHTECDPSDTTTRWIWYLSKKITKTGNSITIVREGHGTGANTDPESGSLHVYMPADPGERCELGAKINVKPLGQTLKKCNVSFYIRGSASAASLNAAQICFYNGSTKVASAPLSTSALNSDDWVKTNITVEDLQEFNVVELYFGKYSGTSALNIDIDDIEIVSDNNSDKVALRDYGDFLTSSPKITYYVVQNTGAKEYSSATWLTGEIPLATEVSIGGFVNVPDTYMDAGYVRLNENGHLVLNDYALLRTGVLAYQLGENFSSSAGLSASSIQTELDEHVNRRVAFPNAKHMKEAENTGVIEVTLNLSKEDENSTINVYDIDSRFNTCVYLHIRGEAGASTTVNISDCARLRLDIAPECRCDVKLARCNLYYDAHVLDRLNYISDMDLWYQRFSESDEWLQVTGRKVTQIAGPVGWEAQSLAKTDAADIHYQYALKALTFSSNGNIVGIDLAVKNELTNISNDSTEYLHVCKFRVPQASGFTYPESRLVNRIKVSGRFVSIPSVTEPEQGVTIVETDFVAVNTTYNRVTLDNAISGTITFLTKVHMLKGVYGLGDANSIAGWASTDYHIFHGDVAHESNT